MSDTLIFVYNADSGLFNDIKDLIHKNVSPQTYPCSLCAVTWDNRGMKREWMKFIESLNRTVEFLHRDELQEKYGIRDVPLPAAFTKCMDESPQLWLDSEKMNACKTLDEVEQMVKSNLN